ncbi:MAG: thioesterase family protein [Lutisporaceae bacterium]
MAENYYESKLRVRYAETDAMGIVYHSNYYVWFEVGRGDFLRRFDMSYKQMEEIGIILPVVESHCRYRIPAQYDDLLTIRTQVKELGAVKLSFQYQVIRDLDNTLLAEGETVHAFTDKTKKPLNMKKKNSELYNLLMKAANKGE